MKSSFFEQNKRERTREWRDVQITVGLLLFRNESFHEAKRKSKKFRSDRQGINGNDDVHSVLFPTETKEKIWENLFGHKLKTNVKLVVPSAAPSQKQELAVWRPAPLFCMMTQETMYLKGLFSLAKELRTASTTLVVQVLIFDWW